MSTIDLRALGLACGLLAVAACENIPVYDESLGWFSRSDYDAEINAIERRIPPPEASPTMAPASGDAAAAEDAVAQPAWMPSLAGPEGGTGARARPPVITATLPPRERIAPVGGYAQSKRIIYGGNRGPFSSAGMRILR